MNWSVFFATFTTIFIAELGDKTQFAAFAASAQSKSTVSVWLGTVVALAIAGTLGVLAGSFIGKYISPEKMKILSGSAFIVMGIWILFKKN